MKYSVFDNKHLELVRCNTFESGEFFTQHYAYMYGKCYYLKNNENDKIELIIHENIIRFNPSDLDIKQMLK